MQIVFEIASCPRQDLLPENASEEIPGGIHEIPSSISLSTPSSQLFPNHQIKCETFVRSILLRAQYGGMACDVQMLHSFTKLWLNRFRSSVAPASVALLLTEKEVPISVEGSGVNNNESGTKDTNIYWRDFPQLLHDKSNRQSEKMVTSTLVSRDGLWKLTITDVCAAGIDFHCSSVVEYLLSQPSLYASLCELLIPLKRGNVVDRDWISGQVKRCIWNHSSGVNRRQPLFEKKDGNSSEEDLILKDVWNDVLKLPFDDFTKKFVRDRLS